MIIAIVIITVLTTLIITTTTPTTTTTTTTTFIFSYLIAMFRISAILLVSTILSITSSIASVIT